MNSFNYITAGELFERVEKILRSEGSPVVCKMIYETLELVCQAGLSNTLHGFGNLSSQIDSLCKRHNITPQDTVTIQRARRDSIAGAELSHEDLLYDCRALCLFISAVMDVSVPSTLVGRIPAVNKPADTLHHVNYRYIRCIVKSWDEQSMRVAVDHNGVEGMLTVPFAGGPDYIDLSYLPGLLTEGMQLNLLDCEVKDGKAVPLMVVVEPDYLLDVSLLASCFEDYGHHPLLYTLKRMMARPNNIHTLLGNFAGAALDDLVNHPESTEMAQTLKTNFRDKALEFVTCPDFDPIRFKQNAVLQMQNMRAITDDLFRHYDRENAVLEPSFVCEQLGLQGRVDLMTTDMHLLVEQKSGKNIYVERNTAGLHGRHIEKHYVQMLLYYGILACNFLVSRRKIDMFLLYSKYSLPDGLMEVEPLQKLLREAVQLRNQIVANEYAMARDGFAEVLPLLTPEVMNTKGQGGFFYEHYLRPQLESLCTPLHTASPLEQAYFCRMMTFALKEQLLGKVGVAGASGSAVADLWNMPLTEKREMGNIYIGLRIVEKQKDPSTGGVVRLKLSVPDQGDDFLPNFRRNDMVYLYAYDGVPDVRKSILLRGTMVEISSDTISIGLSNRQHNEQLTDTEQVYAVEHAGSDAGGAAAINGLYTFLTAPAERRALLLCQRQPLADTTRQLSRSYHPDYDEVLLKAMRSKDYFLLQGPPGTGKTSMALRFLVEEELASRSSDILLTAYTNRAVDEICGMLCSAGIPFVRLGGEYSCDPQYKSYLLGSVVEKCSRLDAVQDTLRKTQVVVGTTSMLMAHPFIFGLKQFSLLIVDEASQILEPGIVGLLSMTSARFILVGDHKQLPAVVQQSAEESAVAEESLQAIGLTNCRNSLFERLFREELRSGREDFVGVLHKQGRMHPAIAEYPNRMFYAREQLQPVPLPHQKESSSYPRMVFIDVPSRAEDADMSSDKVNPSEAAVVAQVMANVYRHHQEAFDPEKTLGVIVPYRNQIAMIRRELEKLDIPTLLNVSIDTVERYQGSQRDVIIYSFTVSHRYQLDFLTANCFEEDGMLIDRKLNVAMTRARKQLVMTGNADLLSQNQTFRQLIEYVKKL